MLDFEHRYPTHFDKYAYRGDIKDLTGKERWRLINGEQLPAIQTKKTAK